MAYFTRDNTEGFAADQLGASAPPNSIRRTTMACANVKVSELRTAYMPGRAKTGSADTSAIGITYYGKPIHRMEFGRYNYVAFYNDGGKFAAFQDNAGIDD